jgi:hypothetical protein
MRTGGLMIVIAFLCAWLGLPFEWLTPQGQLYRQRADRLAVLAAECRAQERRARSKGDLEKAEQSRLKAEGLEQQGWTYRKASFYHWKWPELKP